MVRRIEGEPHLLVIRDPYGKWGLPKGHLEDGESDVVAAAREVREETGLEDVEVGPPLTTLEWTFTRNGGRVVKRCTFFLMRSLSGDVTPQVEEGITACAWLPIREAAERIDYENTRAVVRMAEEKVCDE